MLAIRPGEGRVVALLAGLFATIEAARGAGEVAYTTLFLNRLGPEFLPYLYIALGAVSLVVALGYGVGLGRLPRRPCAPLSTRAARRLCSNLAASAPT